MVLAETLMTFAADEGVTCLHRHEDSGLLVVGCSDGAVRLAFPRGGPAASGDGGEDERGIELQEVRKGTEDSAADVERGGDATVEYDFVTLRNWSKEAVRTAYLDPQSGRLLVTAGDSSVLVWNLSELEEETDGSIGAKCQQYAFDRHHSFGTCVNAFLFQHEREFLLVIRNSVNLYALSFADGAWHAPAAATAEADLSAPEDGGAEHRPLVSREDGGASASSIPGRAVPQQREVPLTTPSNSLPCSYDGKHLVFLKSDRRGEYEIEVRDWLAEKVVRSILLQRSVFNSLTPTAVQAHGDLVMAVVNFNRILVWSISSGARLYDMKGHGHGSRIVAARFCRPAALAREAVPATLVLSLGTDHQLLLWQDGHVAQRVLLDPGKSRTGLGGPFFLEPQLRKSEGGRWVLDNLIYNDDSGIHVLAL